MSKSVRREIAIERAVEIDSKLAKTYLYPAENEISGYLESDDFDDTVTAYENEDQDDGIIEIERIENLGISINDINRLKAAGLHTVAGVMMRPKKELLNIKGITESKLEKLLEVCAQLNFSSFMTGVEILSKRKSIVKITTGSEALDRVLGGGIESTTITEVFGEFRSGKTQLAHTLCVTAQLPKENRGGNGKVAYIDTAGTFRPERIIPIAERFGIDPMMTLENVVCARAYTYEHQDALITTIAAKMVEDQFALLIVDSFTGLFRVDFSGREELSMRQQSIGKMINKLGKIANEFNISVLITNQVTSDPSAGSMAIGGDPKKPIGGNVLAHASTTRLSLRKGRGEQRICKMYDSPCLAEEEAIFRITNGGIADEVQSQ